MWKVRIMNMLRQRLNNIVINCAIILPRGSSCVLQSISGIFRYNNVGIRWFSEQTSIPLRTFSEVFYKVFLHTYILQTTDQGLLIYYSSTLRFFLYNTSRLLLITCTLKCASVFLTSTLTIVKSLKN